MAVGARVRSEQPASPDTGCSTTTPRFTSSMAMPGKSAGVGAGGEVETTPHAATSSATRPMASKARWSDQRPALRSAGRWVGDIEPRLSPGGRERRWRPRAPLEAASAAATPAGPAAVSGLARGAWPREGGPSCRMSRAAVWACSPWAGRWAASERAVRRSSSPAPAPTPVL